MALLEQEGKGILTALILGKDHFSFHVEISDVARASQSICSVASDLLLPPYSPCIQRVSKPIS